MLTYEPNKIYKTMHVYIRPFHLLIMHRDASSTLIESSTWRIERWHGTVARAIRALTSGWRRFFTDFGRQLYWLAIDHGEKGKQQSIAPRYIHPYIFFKLRKKNKKTALFLRRRGVRNTAIADRGKTKEDRSKQEYFKGWKV